MVTPRSLLVTTLVLAAADPAAAQPARVAADIDQVLTRLRDPELLERTYGALGAAHLAGRQWGFALFDGPELRPWQRALAPGVPVLVQMLAEDGGLEWVDQNGMTEKTTTPRQEATRALLALERASIEPLIAALDQKPLARKADELLRRITRSGPAQSDKASWQQWWAQHQGQPLPNEHGQLWLVLLVLLMGAAAAVFVFRLQRTAKQKSLRPPPPAASPQPS